MFKSTFILAASAAVLATGISGAHAEEHKKSAHWGYGAKNGPAKWATMHPKFRLCGAGKQQSPVNIPTKARAAKSILNVAYRPGSGTIVNNGHTIQVNVPKGNVLTAGGRQYRLLQFHFHTPSENHLGGRSFPMEMHLVHKSDDGKLAVVSVMIVTGGDGTSVIDRLPLPKTSGTKRDLGGLTVNPAALLPKARMHFSFGGSLTTPPCSEGVAWFVMATPIKVGANTLRRFHAILGNNNRPINPLNGRSVTLMH